MALELDAINPVRLDGFLSGLMFAARWELTCGFCRNRFEGNVTETVAGSSMSWIACPACGTHNLLPHHPSSVGSRDIRQR